jgi:hypothetical protein
LGEGEAYRIPIRLRGLPTTEVAKGPCCVAQHAQLAAVTKEVQERAESTLAEDVVPALRAVSSNVAQGPNCLLTNIGLGTGEKLDENGDSASLDNDLSLGGRTGSYVREGPGSLELDQGMRRTQELDKSADDTSLDHLFDRRVPLLR